MKYPVVIILIPLLISSITALPGEFDAEGFYFSDELKIGDTFQWQITKFNTSVDPLNQLFTDDSIITAIITKIPDQNFVNSTLIDVINDMNASFTLAIDDENQSVGYYSAGLEYREYLWFGDCSYNTCEDWWGDVSINLIQANRIIAKNGTQYNYFDATRGYYENLGDNLVLQSTYDANYTLFYDSGIVKQGNIALDLTFRDGRFVYAFIDYHLIESDDTLDDPNKSTEILNETKDELKVPLQVLPIFITFVLGYVIRKKYDISRE